MMRRNYAGEHRLVCITDNPHGVEIETFPLWGDHARLRNPNGGHLPSCYRRLKIFSTPQLEAMDVEVGERVVSMDLDVVIMKDITGMFESDNDFMGWKRVSSNPKKPAGYNGSVFMFRAGKFDFLWDTFDAVTSPMRTRKAKQFGSDQGWISFNLDGRGPGWTQASGMYSYSSDICSVGRRKPWPNARIVSFNGKHKPWMGFVKAEHPWIARHYW